MSTSCIRVYEVKCETINCAVNTMKDLEAIQDPFVGMVVKVWDWKLENHYYTYTNDGWIGKRNCEYHWEMCELFSTKKSSYEEDNVVIDQTEMCRNWYFDDCSVIRDNYIRNSWGESNLSNRGLPTDCSAKARETIDEGYSYTYITVDEWEIEYGKQLNNWKARLIEKFNNKQYSEILEKLNEALAFAKNQPYEKPEVTEDDEEWDDFETLFREDIWDLISIQDEITRARLIAEFYNKTYSESNIRIIYYLA